MAGWAYAATRASPGVPFIDMAALGRAGGSPKTLVRNRYSLSAVRPVLGASCFSARRV
jgi:hypothetical protein